MTKPKPKPKDAELDYLDMKAWMKQKYKYDERDFAGKFTQPAAFKRVPGTVMYDQPYLNFWHWFIDAVNGEVHNGCSSYMALDEWIADPETPDWVRFILTDYNAEFGQYADEEGYLNIYIWW